MNSDGRPALLEIGNGARSVKGTGVESPEIGVISLALDAWSPRWNSRHQVLTRLARYFQVAWLNPAPEWRRAVHAGRIGSRQTTPPGLPASFIVHDSSAFTPIVYRPQLVGGALERWRLRAARSALQRRGCTRIVLYLWHVDFASALRSVAHDLSVYHIYDEYSHAERERPMDEAERRLIQSAGQVITVSPTMFERKGTINRHTTLLSNGVDYTAFATPAPKPADLVSIPRPRIGYTGFIKRQLDWDLLSALAARHPEWSFVFVGAKAAHPDIDAAIERLQALPNVHFLGAKSTDDLARYPQHLDVCLMPYRVNDYTKYIYPLKLHEYLASGQPVVSVPLPALAGIERLVSIASGLDQWEAAIGAALGSGPNAGERALRQAEAARHDWSVIVDQIAALIRHRLAERTAAP